jgi:hypothetical protein
MGGGGRGTRLWWGGARYSRKQCSSVGETWGEGGRGTMSSSARSSGAELGCAGSVGRRGVEGVAWAGQARARGRSVERT